jgi:regulatory protein
MAVALRMLSRRAVSEAEVRRRLSEKEIPGEEVERTVARLLELGLLDDRRLCEGLVRTFRESRRYGRAKIVLALRRRLLPQDVVESVVREASGGEEELETAVAALKKKFHDGIPPGREGSAKAFRFLAGRGFPMETCRKALGKALSEIDETEGDP